MSEIDELLRIADESLHEVGKPVTPEDAIAYATASIAASLLAIAKLLQEQQKPTTTHIPTKPPRDLRPYDEKERP